MGKREWMIRFREERHIPLPDMAAKIRKPGQWRCSEKLLNNLEMDDGYVTHPVIAQMIAEAYNATPEQAELLLPRHRRPHDPEYDPDRYILEMDWEHGRLPGGLSGRMMM